VSHAFGDDHLGDSHFDFTWLSQILYYFDEPTFQRLFNMARRRLRPGGVMAGDILGPASDRSFLRDPKPPVHTPESLDWLAHPHGFCATGLGELSSSVIPRSLGFGTIY
jgi:SAM-dependent methyltransferase